MPAGSWPWANAGNFTMIASPCNSCADRFEDKNRPVCINCIKRQEYSEALGRMAFSVPIEMTDHYKGNRQMNEKVQTKICSDPKCKSAGRAQPITNFYKCKNFVSSLNPNGYMNVCSECKRRQQRERTASLKKQSIDPTTPAIPNEIVLHNPGESLKAVNKSFVVIDFSRHADLYDQIVTAAAADFRTPDLQILYFCSQALNVEP